MANDSMTANRIYTYIRGKILATYPTAYVTSQTVRISEKFPTVDIVLASKTRIRSAINFANNDEQYRWTYRINVYTDKEDRGISQANAIMNTIVSAMRELGFADESILQIENIDVTIYRLVGTFARVICGADLMPSSQGV